MSIKRKIILIIGANRGIGKAIIKDFLNQKNYVIIGTSTTKVGVEKINVLLKNRGKGILLNLSKKKLIFSILKKIKLEFGDINILIHNAGILDDNLLINMNENCWKSVIDINLNSIFYITKPLIKNMIKNRFGRVILVGSIIGSIGNIGQTNYATAKSGMIGFMKSLAQEVAIYNITVNIISPGFISTNMTDSLSKKIREKILLKIPMRKFGRPKDIARVISFFSSEKSEYITGQTIHVNGGMYMP